MDYKNFKRWYIIYKKILIGIDGSEHSYKALMKAIDLQILTKSKVIIFHSVEHHAEPAGGMFMAPSFGVPQVFNNSSLDIQRIKEVYEQNAQAIIGRAKEIFMEQGIEADTRLVIEHEPVSYIKNMVEKEGVDLVILGSKGNHSLLEEILLGSVADKVLRHIPVDILIIR
ncbi:MAG: universal stress protein [Promethearchaeota archaeon]